MKSQITLLAVLSLGVLGAAPLLTPEAYGEDEAVSERMKELGEAKELLREAAEVVEQMNNDEDARRLLKQAHAVFIVPDYLRASFIAGAAGGQGVLISRTEDGWSGPAFYNIGAINLGAAAGVEAGAIAFLLFSDDALQGFRDVNNFSLNADAGLTILNWSERAQATAGKGADVVVWSDTEGLYGALVLNVSDIFWDDEANAAYYLEPVAIIVGELRDPMADSQLRSEFSALEEGDQAEQSAQDDASESTEGGGSASSTGGDQ